MTGGTERSRSWGVSSWRRVAFVALGLGALGFGVARPGAGEGPPETCCKGDEEAHRIFAAGVGELVRGRDLERARDFLCRAACCLPESTAGEIPIQGFATAPYLPFFFLGTSYLRLGDHCQALASFNLSECRGEVLSAEDRRRQLEAGRSASRRYRPPTSPAFGEGLVAFRETRWREAAEKMQEAIDAWDEDGEPAKPYGRWPTDRPYLPRYYLARALLELGCVEEAVALALCSRLGQCQLAGDESEDPEAFLAEGSRRIASLGEEPGECGRWRRAGAEGGDCCACARCAKP
jgi:hypothetical protein